jgi:hypothetical protein
LDPSVGKYTAGKKRQSGGYLHGCEEEELHYSPDELIPIMDCKK